MSKVKLSIVILSWNTRDRLRQCLKSLKTRAEIIVVDNGSADGSAAMIKAEFPQVRLIENKQNLGFAQGNNQGLKKAKGEYFLLLNSDTVVKEGALEKLIDFLEKNPQTAVSPLLELPNGHLQTDYYMRFPNLWQIFLYHHPLLRPLMMKTPLKKLICREVQKQPFEVDQLPGAALAASREVWRQVGGLDEDFQFLWEDVDWSWRARKKGVRLVVVPGARVVHWGGASWKQKIKENAFQFYYQFFASWLLFVRKNYGQEWEKVYWWAIIANFFLTLKPVLAFRFWKNGGKQLPLWQ